MNGVAKALNAVIAWLEDRPALFKELLRAPDSNVKDIPDTERRLRKAMNSYAATQIRAGLMQTLHVTPSVRAQENDGRKQCFFDGVRAAEEIFERLAQELEQ